MMPYGAAANFGASGEQEILVLEPASDTSVSISHSTSLRVDSNIQPSEQMRQDFDEQEK